MGRSRKAASPESALAEPVAGTLSEISPIPEIPELPEASTPEGDAFDLGDGRALAVSFRTAANVARPAPTPSPEPFVPSAEPAPTAVLPRLLAEDGEEPLPTFSFRSRDARSPAPESPTRVDAKRSPTPASPPRPSLDVADEEMPLLSWRPRGTGSPVPDEDDEATPPERGARRGRRSRGAREETEETPTAFFEGPGSPASGVETDRSRPARPAVKPPLAVPPDAPQVVLRNGVPVLVRDGRAFPALAFGGDPQGPRGEALTFEQLRMAAVDGVHLHILRLAVVVDAEAVAEIVERAASLLAQAGEADPAAQVVLSIDFETPRDLGRRFPDALYRGTDGREAAPSVCDDGYWGEAAHALGDLVKALKGDARLMGLQLDHGWHHPEAEGYDTSPAAAAKFRAWTRTRYGDDVVALRAAWFDGTARFDSIVPPDAADAARPGDRFIRSGRRGRRVVDYHLFLSDTTAARLADLAMAVKEASEGCLLVGVGYGETLEGSHPSGGHLALGKVMRTPEIDFVAGPPSYASREAGGSAAFAAPVDSFPLNGKLYLSIEDYRTSLGGNLHLDGRAR